MRNACEAMSLQPLGQRQLAVLARRQAKAVVVSVIDSGCGVKLDQTFLAFVSSKPERLGLGLAICKSIVEAHYGRISHETDAAQGAAFHFSLPLESPTMPAVKTGSSANLPVAFLGN